MYENFINKYIILTYMTTYKFITKLNQHESPFMTPLASQTSFYQIALHPNPKNKLYHVRKFKIDENDNISSMSEYNIPKNKYEQLIKSKKQNEYKQYSVFDLKSVGYPQRGDVLLLKSNILSSGNNYTGFAPVGNF
jgi:hypothetical protein